MTNNQKEPLPYAWTLIMTEERSHEYYHLNVRLMPLADNGYAYSDVIWKHRDGSLAAQMYILGFFIYSQGNCNDPEEKRYLYGIEPHFDRLHRPSMRDLLEIQKPVKAFQAKMDKLQKQFGTPETIGEYAVLAASALGVTVYAQSSSHWDGYNRHGMDQLRYELGSRERSFKATGKTYREALEDAKRERETERAAEGSK